MRKINEIIIHCSATRPDWMSGYSLAAKCEEIARWHRARGWRGIGYHYIIGRDGQLAQGRPVEQQGAHVKGHNRWSIGICLLGGHGSAKTDYFEDNFTAEQRKTLLSLIGELRERFGNIPVMGHNDYANKACPGFDVHAFMADAIMQPHIIDEPHDIGAEPVSIWASIINAILAFFKGEK